MSWLKSILTEIYGLFVDDGAFAVSILVWLAMVAFVLPTLHLSSLLRAILLFVGLALLLVGSALRQATRK